MKLIKQLFCALFALGIALSGAAAVTADYLFTLVIDENIRDMSGNHRVPECHFGEGDFVTGDFDAVRFSKANHAILVPAAAFSPKSGTASMKVNLENLDGNRVLFQVYHPKGDVLNMFVRDGKLRASYHNRQTKKTYNIIGPQLNVNTWYDLKLSWISGKKIVLHCDDWEQGRSTPKELPMNFHPESKIVIGNNYVLKAAISGKLHRFTLEDGKPGKKAAAAQPEKAGKSRFFQLGKFSIGINARGEITRLAAADTQFVAESGTPLWVMNTMDKKDGKFHSFKPSGKVRISPQGDFLVLQWKNASATIRAIENGDTLTWELQAEAPANHVLDTIEYPRLKLQPTTAEAEKMRFVYPSYFGCSKPDPFSVKDGKPRSFGNTYGGGAHYQFCFVHAPDKPGLYIETRDGEGSIKEFRFNSSGDKTAVFHLTQMPELRLNSAKFSSRYEVRTALLKGDWYDAAKKYRQWAIKQKWCQNGKLHENKIVPQWLKNCDFAIRIHTWTRKVAPRRASTNAAKATCFADLLGKPQTLGIWYSLTYLPNGDTSGTENGNARSDIAYAEGSLEAMKVFTANNQHVIHYLNSRIFDQSRKADHPETNRIRQMVMRDHKGGLQLYGKMWYEGCRVDTRWQDHLLKLIKRDIGVFGFRGTYLDSFGRGQEFCYSTDHGHKPAFDRGSINGQRVMATRIKSEMRKNDPGYILCSEASIEQFVDLIDVKLHHYNVFEDSVPIWAAVYHDYQLVHGRTMESEKGGKNTPESNAALAAGAFHNGAIIGRFFADRGNFKDHYFLGTLQGYYLQISACRQLFRDFLSYGEMLRPPQVLNSTAPAVTLSVRKQVFQHPTVIASCWQAPDSRKIIVVTNASGQKASCEIASSEVKPTEIVRFTAEGKDFAQPLRNTKLELEPFSVVVLR